MTEVKFLIEIEDGELTTNVFAFFPNEKCDVFNENMVMSYSHIGQHSACHTDYAKACKEAKYNEFSDLLKELIGLGYKDLLIMNNQVIKLHRKPTMSEIKFGEGATHYRVFKLSDVISKKTGNIKKWIVAKDDGLRYYY